MAQPKVRKQRLNRWGLKGQGLGGPQGHRSRNQPYWGASVLSTVSLALTLLRRLSELAWVTCPFLGQKMAELLKGLSHPDLPKEMDFLFPEHGTGYLGDVTTALHCVIVDVHIFPSVPLPRARLPTSWKEEVLFRPSINVIQCLDGGTAM